MYFRTVLKFVLSIFAFVLQMICQSVDENCDECGAWRAPSGTLAVLVLVTTDMVGSKMCSLRSKSIFSLPHLVFLQWILSMCIFIAFYKLFFLTCDSPSTPIPIQLLRGPSEQPELEWCSLKPQNLRVLS